MRNIVKKTGVSLILLSALGLAACSSTPEYRKAAAKGGVYKVGNPYQIAGRWYYPKEDKYYNKVGIASWYGPTFHGKGTAIGEVYDMNELSAAHTTLPMPSYVRVTNLENGRFLILRINDRGPFVNDRIIDVSRRAAQLLGFEAKGTATVRVEAVTPLGETPVQEASASPPPPMTSPDNPAMPATPPGRVEKAELAVASSDIIRKAEIADQTANEGRPVKAGTPAAPAPSQSVFVQVGSFAASENARRLSKSIRHIGASSVSAVNVQGRDFFRVRVGPFASMHEADAMLGKIVAQGLNAARIVVE